MVLQTVYPREFIPCLAVLTDFFMLNLYSRSLEETGDENHLFPETSYTYF